MMVQFSSTRTRYTTLYIFFLVPVFFGVLVDDVFLLDCGHRLHCLLQSLNAIHRVYCLDRFARFLFSFFFFHESGGKAVIRRPNPQHLSVEKVYFVGACTVSNSSGVLLSVIFLSRSQRVLLNKRRTSVLDGALWRRAATTAIVFRPAAPLHVYTVVGGGAEQTCAAAALTWFCIRWSDVVLVLRWNKVQGRYE